MATTDPTAVAHAVHELEKAMLHIFASRCLAVAGVSILAYDHLLTFPQEVELIWNQKRSWVSVLFVLNRYITPLVLIVDVFDKGGLTNYLSKSFCVNWYYAESMWNLVSFGLIHALVALRVHAIWGRPRWLSIALCSLFALYFVITATIAIKFEIEFADTVAYNPLFRLCFAQVSPYLWTCWLPALVYESFIFILTIIKAVEYSNKKVNTPVVHVLYRDGIVYFIIISICSVFNMMVWLLAPPTLVALSKYFVLCVVPTMGARLVLNLRGSRREDIMPTGRSTSGDDNAAYEMHHPKGTASGGTSSNGRGVIFISHSPGAALSAQDRVQLNQIKSNSNYYRLKDGKAHMV